MPKPHQEFTDTSRELRSINDSKFEILVAGYLRRRHPEFAGLIATGINEDGEAIPCPVDGILYIAGSPPRCVAIASTTTSRKELSRKWLGAPNKRGDILKAADEFQSWKRDIPGVECVVYIATNLPLKSNTQLYRQAVAQGHDHGIHVELIEASQLVDFLDHDRDGQYIREKVLDIEAERLSEDLLRDIARRSLIYHRSRFSVSQGENVSEIVRDVHARVVESLSGKSLIGIQGASGTGKSTLLRQVGTSINAMGGIALWLPAEDIVQGTSLATILLIVLRRFHPSLNPRAGDDAVHLVSLLPNGLTLLVDDVNRLPSPHQALAAIQALSETVKIEAAATIQQSTSGVRFIVPLWPGQLVSRHSQEDQDNAAWQFILLSTYSARERTALIKQFTIDTGVQHMIETLNGDPFLCGLAAAINLPALSMSPAALIARIFSDVLYRATTDAAGTRSTTATRGEFASALDKLIEFLLRIQEPEPEWGHIRAALGDRQADLLYVLSQTNQLSWIEQTNTQETWRWKHDRLRDALVGRWLAHNAAPRVVRGELSEILRGWLSDPGLAEAWALSLAFLVDKTQQATLLTALGEHHPLALAEILRLNLFPHENDLRHIIAIGLRHSLENFDERGREFVGSPQRWILEKLSQTNDSLVLDATDNLGRSWNIWAARLRNGDIWAGLEWISEESARGDFLPSVRFVLLEQSIEAFATLYDHQRHIVEQELTQAMRRTDMAEAAMILAGYVAWPDLSLPMWDVWSALDHSEQLKTLTACIWALSRGADQSMQPKLVAALLMVLELSDQEREKGHGSERY